MTETLYRTKQEQESDLKNKKNLIDPGWPNYMVNRFTLKAKAVPEKIDNRK